MTRRRFLGTLPSVALFRADPAHGRPPAAEHLFEPFDRAVRNFMQERQVPGGALAVVRHGKLVYANGYGWADRERRISARPESLFRIASVSKPITAVAVLSLAEQKKLEIEANALDLLGLDGGLVHDSRWKKITVSQLLHHTGGWDSARSFDPMFRSRQIAAALGVSSPPNAEQVVRHMLGQPLDFDPGTRYAYSNFGYCVLGRIIEKVSHMRYEEFVGQLLKKIGIRRMRLGRSLFDDRAADEAAYYTLDNQKTVSVFGTIDQLAPWPYGGFCLESMDAHGGWLASVIDLARFVADLDAHGVLLSSAAREKMYTPPPAPVWRNSDGQLNNVFYGCGWLVRTLGQNGKPNYWHNGSLPGTHTLVVRRGDGLSWAAFFNQRSEKKDLPDLALDPALHAAANAMAWWPDHDLFPDYFPARG